MASLFSVTVLFAAICFGSVQGLFLDLFTKPTGAYSGIPSFPPTSSYSFSNPTGIYGGSSVFNAQGGFGYPGAHGGFSAQGFGSPGFSVQGFGSPGFGQALGSRGYGSVGFGTQGFGTPSYGLQGFGSQGFGSQGFGAPGFTTQGFGSQGYIVPGYSTQGYGTPIYGTSQASSNPTFGYQGPSGTKPYSPRLSYGYQYNPCSCGNSWSSSGWNRPPYGMPTSTGSLVQSTYAGVYPSTKFGATSDDVGGRSLDIPTDNQNHSPDANNDSPPDAIKERMADDTQAAASDVPKDAPKQS